LANNKTKHKTYIKLTKSITAIFSELKDELEKMVFDPTKIFIKFHLHEVDFDFLPNLVAYYHEDFRKCYGKKRLVNLMKFKSISFQKGTFFWIEQNWEAIRV